MSLRRKYQSRRDGPLTHISSEIERHLAKILKAQPRIDRISARAKSVDSFCRKAVNKKDDGSKKYVDPLNEILDQVGARIIVFYPQDIPLVSQVVLDYFNAIETKEMEPALANAFGYFGRHFILPIPSEAYPEDCPVELPEHFELQVKTMFQHAWSEANHDLAYKLTCH